MSHPSAPRALVLHALRLKGFAETDVVAAHAGLPLADSEALLRDMAADGLTTYREGRISGWSLTRDGRERHRDLVGAELDQADARSDVHEAYRDFLAVNEKLLHACTAWQVRGGAANDHTNAAHDADVLADLREVHRHIRPVCDRLAASLDRFARYGERFDRALARVEKGETEWFARPLIDSYHTVWFELHEDLLCTLGIERSKEEAPH